MSLFIICQSTPAYDRGSFPYFPYMKAKSALPKDHCGVPASARQEGIGGQGIGAAWWWAMWAMWAMWGGKKEDARQARFVSLPNQGSGVG